MAGSRKGLGGRGKLVGRRGVPSWKDRMSVDNQDGEKARGAYIGCFMRRALKNRSSVLYRSGFWSICVSDFVSSYLALRVAGHTHTDVP